MGNSLVAPAPTAGAVIVTIESDECCSIEPLIGRKWDPSLPMPHFVGMSAEAWDAFTEEMATLVRSYKPEGVAFVALAVFVFLGFLFHPAIGAIGRGLASRGVCTSMMLMMLFFLVGVTAMIAVTISFRQANERVDREIDAMLARASASCPTATFTLARWWTGACKPKGTRTYRALYISPASASAPPGAAAAIVGQPQTACGIPIASTLRAYAPSAQVPPAATQAELPIATGSSQPTGDSVVPATAQPVTGAMVMAVVLPPEYKAGDTLELTAPDGRVLNVVVPEGIEARQTFHVTVPPSEPVVVTATVVDLE